MSWALGVGYAVALGPGGMAPSFLVSDASATTVVDFATVLVRHAPWLLLLVLHLYTTGAAAEESCSKALGFNDSSSPMDRSGQDLLFCTEHHKRTCCERNHTRQVLASYASFSQERSARCTQMSRLALCGLCDADVGIGLKAEQNAIRLCPSFCSRWFDACRQDFFAPSGSTGLAACSSSSLVCSPLQEITEDSATFCSRVSGFVVAESEEDPDTCFDGIPAARARGRGVKAPYQKPEPQRPPWWRRFLAEARFSTVVEETWQALLPSFVVAGVVLLFTWYLWRNN